MRGRGLQEVIDAEREIMPADVYVIGSMLDYDERLLLHWAARTTDVGAVVDLGAFLGGSTLALASGAQHRGSRVYSYDLFRLTEPWELHWLPEGSRLELGDCTLRVVEANIARVHRRVELRQGDIEQQDWRDGPIGVLFVDIAKSWTTGDHVWRTFLPHVVPGGLVIQQDLVHWGHPWNAIIMELLADHFEYLGWVWYSSAVYRCVSPIAAPGPLLGSLGCDEMVELVDRAAGRIGDPWGDAVRLSAAFVYGAFGLFDEARARVEAIRAGYDRERMGHIEEGLAYLDWWIDAVRTGRRKVR